MTLYVGCLLLVCVMPFLAKVPLAVAMHRHGGYDNALPREQQQSLKGFGARANAAHYNCFEAITYFAPAALVVLATSSVGTTHIALALSFVACRILYLFCYWYAWNTLRSVAFVAGLAISIALFITVM